MIQLVTQSRFNDALFGKFLDRLQADRVPPSGRGDPSRLSRCVAIKVYRREDSDFCAVRKAPTKGLLAHFEKTLGDRQDKRVRPRIGADEIETLRSAFLPLDRLRRSKFRAGIIEAEYFAITLVFTAHFFSARLAESDSVA